MIDFIRGKIGDFPVGMKGTDRFDVVFIGNVVPNYSGSDIGNLMRNDYVFLFITQSNGHVGIYLERHERLSYFNHQLREQGSFHFLENESLILNDFLEIVPVKNENGIRVIAHLKNQEIFGDGYQVKRVEDFRVLLLKENKGESCDNLPILELGPEFQAALDFHKAEEHYYDLCNFSFMLQNIIKKNSKSGVNEVVEAMNKEIDNAKLKYNQAFDYWLDCKRPLSYIHKSTI